MNTRIYIAQKIGFDNKTNQLQKQLQQLQIEAASKVYTTYDIFNIKEEELETAINSVLCDIVTENHFTSLPQHQNIFAIEYLPGQYDARADAAMQCCQLLFHHSNIYIQTSQVIGVDDIDEKDLEKIKKYLINPVDSREKNLTQLEKPNLSKAEKVKIFENFTSLTEIELQKFLKEQNLSIDIEDIKCIQQYFIEENRNPTETEIKALDTYWSDHCRHTTFLTELENISIEGDYKIEIEKTFQKYLACKKELGREHKPTTLMDLGTLPAKYLHKKGFLKDWHQSKENNAATIEIDIDVKDKTEKWLLLFKNETHNHPTEIEPFGGAATCIGGAIRDPLSGRSYVYQAMRLSGSANPLEPITETLSGKLPQHKISKEAALGYSSYGNQIGLATSLVSEIYDDGYKAKRFECGFVVAAVNKENVVELDPAEGDVVLLLGGNTGRDGIGGASGSSKQHNEVSLTTMQAEVQKGNALTERKIQTLFRKPDVTKLIKKCNDFGAGGVCVAIGEIADSISIDLNKVPLKYEGLNGTEIALSESQERMAVVIAKENVELFIAKALQENVLATPIAVVTNDGVLRMNWNGEEIVNLKRSFLDTNGASKKVNAGIQLSRNVLNNSTTFNKDNFLKILSSKHVASQKGMVEHFDSTVLGTTCLMPFGGKYQLTPSDVSAHFICDNSYTTNVVSLAAWGYHPEFTTANTYVGAMYAIIESISKLVAAGADYSKCYLTFQEYFERLKDDATKWGKPLSCLLGAFETQYQLGIAAIGGKDSMSGSFNELNVPTTFVSFAIATEKSENIISTEFKNIGSNIYLYKVDADEKQIPNWDLLKSKWNKIYQLIKDKKIVAAKHIKDGGVAATIAQMSFGNKIGIDIETNQDLFDVMLGSIVFESNDDLNNEFILLGKTNSSKQLKINNVVIEIEEAIQYWTNTFESLFPTSTKVNTVNIPSINVSSKTIVNIGFGKPRVLMPVFNGTNCEFETKHAFETERAIVETINFNTLNEALIEQSIEKIVAVMHQSQILMFSGGFSAGDEPDGCAKYIVNVLNNKYIRDAVHSLLEKGGLVLGVCNGFQALIKSGLLPYGKIQNRTELSPTLTFNDIGRHVSQMVDIKVVNDNSPWLQGMKDEMFTIPVSHGEGKFYACDETLQQLIQQNQVATQYVDLSGNSTNVFPFNPNGSLAAVEGLLSEDGKIFGRMAHPERFKEGRFKNIPNIAYHNIFKNGVDYFL
ncbi:MAG: phosphoribosylformylglycinamidine synthase [Bacteroidetes bacterium]|nr:phosphoribosylformylglycinamidine synthase [Bacteroidota bacterium]